MAPKRSIRAVDGEKDDAQASKVAKQAAAAPAAPAKGAAKKKPSSLKEKILDLLAKADKLVGLATIKKVLRDEYDVEDSTAANTRIAKALKELTDEERPDFVKVGGSYHGGPGTPASDALAAEAAAKVELDALLAAHAEDVQCPYCDTWNNGSDTWIGEDSIARGSRHQCTACSKVCFTWISDNPSKGELRGHKGEYKFTKDYTALW